MSKIRITLAAITAIILATIELYVWNKWVSPFFWSDGVAYTDLAWGYVVVAFAFIGIPIAAAMEILGIDD